MSEKRGETRPNKREAPAARRERLASELRANLLKRKAQGKARKAPSEPHDGGGQAAP